MPNTQQPQPFAAMGANVVNSSEVALSTFVLGRKFCAPKSLNVASGKTINVFIRIRFC